MIRPRRQCDEPAYAFQRSVPFGIRLVPDGSNIAADRATASAAVGKSSGPSFASSPSGVADGVDRSMPRSLRVASRVPGPPGPVVVPDVERASVVYYGRHVSRNGRILNNCLCWYEDRRAVGRVR
ncbi:hypothetical protein GCM10008994_27170 [Halorubrum ejinorense]|uniref:Uncharacterized protein n=1 Tax=Halorubrum ejinorense TaxID=425309 RepID=A0AAV3SVN6_9EURY